MANDQDIRLMRQQLSAVRRQLITLLDGMDQRLAAMESPEAHSFQIPRSYDGFCDEYIRSARRAGRGAKGKR